MKHVDVNKSFIELDVLLDTRIGLISGLWPEVAEKLAASPGYFKRVDDKFGSLVVGFPQADFDDTYAARTYAHIHGRCTWTPYARHLQKHVEALEAQKVSNINPMMSELVVNTYPYLLPEAEQAVLKEVLYSKFGFDLVRIVNMSVDMVSPMFLEGFAKFGLYDIDKWMTEHSQALGKSPMPLLEVNCPLIVKKNHGLSLSSVVSETVEAFRPLVRLVPLPLDMFSFKPIG